MVWPTFIILLAVLAHDSLAFVRVNDVGRGCVIYSRGPTRYLTCDGYSRERACQLVRETRNLDGLEILNGSDAGFDMSCLPYHASKEIYFHQSLNIRSFTNCSYIKGATKRMLLDGMLALGEFDFACVPPLAQRVSIWSSGVKRMVGEVSFLALKHLKELLIYHTPLETFTFDRYPDSLQRLQLVGTHLNTIQLAPKLFSGTMDVSMTVDCSCSFLGQFLAAIGLRHFAKAPFSIYCTSGSLLSDYPWQSFNSTLLRLHGDDCVPGCEKRGVGSLVCSHLPETEDDDPITCAQLRASNVSQLVATAANLTSFDFRCLPYRAQRLYLQGNAIAKLFGCTSLYGSELQLLSLSRNKIKGFHLECLPVDKIEFLMLDNNRLTDDGIDLRQLRHLTRLRELYLHQNLLRVLDVAALPASLNLLYLQLNRLHTIANCSVTSARVSQLRHFDISWNQMRSLDFSCFPPRTISIIHARFNLISRLRNLPLLLRFRRLHQLDLSLNHLRTFDLGQLPARVNWLALNGNRITALNLAPLEGRDVVLDVGGNPLTCTRDFILRFPAFLGPVTPEAPANLVCRIFDESENEMVVKSFSVYKGDNGRLEFADF